VSANLRVSSIDCVRRWHLAAAAVFYADGSVRFLEEKRPLPLFRALATLQGGEVLSADSY
jgi:hypothetical protein